MLGWVSAEPSASAWGVCAMAPSGVTRRLSFSRPFKPPANRCGSPTSWRRRRRPSRSRDKLGLLLLGRMEVAVREYPRLRSIRIAYYRMGPDYRGCRPLGREKATRVRVEALQCRLQHAGLQFRRFRHHVVGPRRIEDDIHTRLDNGGN